MILVILFIIAIVLGFILIIIGHKKCWWDLSFPALLAAVGVFGCCVCGVIIPCEKGKEAYNFYYKEWNQKYSGLEARIEAWNRGGEDPYLWEDVKEFNSDLEYAQYWANNYWTNWINEQACNEFETFDIPDYRRSNE